MKRALVAVAILLAVGVLALRREPAPVDLRAARASLDDGILRAVILGDSVARGAGDESGRGIGGSLRAQLPMEVTNLGVDGARTWTVRSVLARSSAQHAVRVADVIVISIGGNDLYGDRRAQLLSRFVPMAKQWLTIASVERVVASAREINPAARIYLLGLYNPYPRSPLTAWLDRQVNLWDARMIARFAGARGVTVIRICDVLDRADRISPVDRFHPGANGYHAIASRIAGAL